MRILTAQDVLQASGGFPNLIPGMVADEFAEIGALIGLGGAIIFGYRAKSRYKNQTPINFMQGLKCTFYTARDAMVAGLIVDVALLAGKYVFFNNAS